PTPGAGAAAASGSGRAWPVLACCAGAELARPPTGPATAAAARLITPRTSAIVGVHVWGRPCAGTAHGRPQTWTPTIADVRGVIRRAAAAVAGPVGGRASSAPAQQASTGHARPEPDAAAAPAPGV